MGRKNEGKKKRKNMKLYELMQVEMNRNLFYMDTSRLFKV